MFDIITDTGERPLRERSLGSKLVAMVAHATVVLVLVVIPLLGVTNQLPPVEPTTDDERRREREAQLRRDNRLAERERIESARSD